MRAKDAKFGTPCVVRRSRKTKVKCFNYRGHRVHRESIDAEASSGHFREPHVGEGARATQA
jgi:hypothetical protein